MLFLHLNRAQKFHQIKWHWACECVHDCIKLAALGTSLCVFSEIDRKLSQLLFQNFKPRYIYFPRMCLLRLLLVVALHVVVSQAYSKTDRILFEALLKKYNISHDCPCENFTFPKDNCLKVCDSVRSCLLYISPEEYERGPKNACRQCYYCDETSKPIFLKAVLPISMIILFLILATSIWKR